MITVKVKKKKKYCGIFSYKYSSWVCGVSCNPSNVKLHNQVNPSHFPNCVCKWAIFHQVKKNKNNNHPDCT